MEKWLLLSALIAAMNASAAPTYYTFTGKINFIPQDEGGYAAAHGIQVGKTVTYTFIVDTAMPGFSDYGGERTDKPDTINPGTGYLTDYFYDALAAPSLFSAAVSDTASGSRFGFHATTQLGPLIRHALAFQTTVGNANGFTQVIVSIPDSGAADFLPKIGTVVAATEAYSDSSGAATSASLTMTCTAVNATRPASRFPGRGPGPDAWLRADARAGFLVMRNNSGREAVATLLDAAGKTLLSLPFRQQASIPLTALPPGAFFLRIAAEGMGQPVLRAFTH